MSQVFFSNDGLMKCYLSRQSLELAGKDSGALSSLSTTYFPQESVETELELEDEEL